MSHQATCLPLSFLIDIDKSILIRINTGTGYPWCNLHPVKRSVRTYVCLEPLVAADRDPQAVICKNFWKASFNWLCSIQWTDERNICREKYSGRSCIHSCMTLRLTISQLKSTVLVTPYVHKLSMADVMASVRQEIVYRHRLSSLSCFQCEHELRQNCRLLPATLSTKVLRSTSPDDFAILISTIIQHLCSAP